MKVMLDPGHGGNDNGAAWGYAEEDDINLSISYLLRFILEKRGIKVYATRERDVFVSLAERCRMTNVIPANLFISIHCDAFHKETASGMSIHIHPNAGEATRKAAANIHRSLRRRFPQNKDRGIVESNFQVLRDTKMPAVLVECEFISNPETRKFLREPENQLALAYAIAEG